MATFIGLIMNSKYQQTLIIYSIFDIFCSELRKSYISLFFKHSDVLFHTLIYSDFLVHKALIKVFLFLAALIRVCLMLN